MSTIGERIKMKRTELGISARKLAIILNTSKENIYKWEGGSTPSDPEVYNRIINWLENVPQETDKGGKSIEAERNYLEKLLEEKEARRVETEKHLERAHSDKDKILEELSALRRLYEREVERMSLSLVQGQQELKEQILESSSTLGKLLMKIVKPAEPEVGASKKGIVPPGKINPAGGKDKDR